MPRLFFALQPQAQQGQCIASTVQALPDAASGVAIPAEDLHLTLCFLGEVPAQTLPALLQGASFVAPHALQLRLTEVDWWQGPRVLCLLPEAGAATQAAAKLAAQLRAMATAAGVAPDPRPFRAHVTARRKLPASLAHAADWPQPLDPPLQFTSNGFVLLQSTRDPAGLRYPVLGRWPAASAAPGEMPSPGS